MLKTFGRIAGIAVLCLSFNQLAYADSLPTRGDSKATVENRHGKPQQKHAAVGNPPISRWDYGKYSVYFEGNTVLHAVDHEEGIIKRPTNEQQQTEKHTTHVKQHGTVLHLPELGEDEPTSKVPTTSDTEDTTTGGEFLRYDSKTGRLITK